MEPNFHSFVSANAIPIKLFFSKTFLAGIESKKIPPLHLQLNPTNKCNKKCSYCSLKKRDKSLELGFDRIEKILKEARTLGCQALTITGGGEPLLHPQINEIIEKAVSLGMEVGLVTNGLALEQLSKESLSRLTWIRVSLDGESKLTPTLVEKIKNARNSSLKTDWGFSYVIGKRINYANLESAIALANTLDFTHVRLISDILDLEHVPDLSKVKNTLVEQGVDDKLVIYQGRKFFTRGAKKCYMGLLKPNIGADGKIYPCCGVQYAEHSPSLDFSKCFVFGKTLSENFEKQCPFDGSACERCYYSQYNEVIDLLLNGIKHKKFV